MLSHIKSPPMVSVVILIWYRLYPIKLLKVVPSNSLGLSQEFESVVLMAGWRLECSAVFKCRYSLLEILLPLWDLLTFDVDGDMCC